MLLSVITVNYNDAAGLTQTIRSVTSQRHSSLEYLILDGGSTDGSQEVIKAHSPQLAYWVSQPDNGTYDAMNAGIAQAHGDYVLFLNSGDCLANDVIAKCSLLLKQNPAIDVLYGDVAVVSATGNNAERQWTYPDSLGLSFFKSQTINHQATFIRRTLFQELGLYPTNYRLAADYWLFVRATLANKYFYHIELRLAIYDDGGVSATNAYQAYKEEMHLIWQELVPPAIRELVDENHRLKNITDARLVKLAAALNLGLRKLLKSTPN